MTDPELEELASLMVWGVGEALHVDGKDYPPFTPLPAGVCADFMGIRRRRARVAMSDPKFRKLFATQLDAMRSGELASNLRTAIDIRDDKGDGTAADRTVRLKAIQAIEGRDGGGGVSVTLNQTNNTLVATPGYVIRLPARVEASPALSHAAAPATIDVTPHSVEVDP